MWQGIDIDYIDLKINKGITLLNPVDIKIIELFLRNIDQKVRFASVQTLLNIIFQQLKANLR